MTSHDLSNSAIKRRVSTSMGQDQDRRSVGPGLDPDCLHFNFNKHIRRNARCSSGKLLLFSLH